MRSFLDLEVDGQAVPDLDFTNDRFVELPEDGEEVPGFLFESEVAVGAWSFIRLAAQLDIADDEKLADVRLSAKDSQLLEPAEADLLHQAQQFVLGRCEIACGRTRVSQPQLKVGTAG